MIKDNLIKIYDSIDSIKNRLNINYNIELMAVSKTRSSDEILQAINCGLTLFGENRVGEAYQKFDSDILKNKKHSLHIIGHLQRNKAKKAVKIANMIQSIDKIETLDVLERICNENNKKIDFLIEINTTNESQRYGVIPKDFIKFLEDITKKSYTYLNLRGLMCVGPFTYDKGMIRNAFKLLNKIFNETKNDLNKDDFNIISMGMSGDYEIAIEEGSNLIRIGSLIFGNRI